jgi:hypothetical protein
VRKARLLVPFLVLLGVSALGLAACGSGESDEDKITKVIETAATSTDPADCKKYETVNFAEQQSGKEGAKAVEECEEQAPEGANNPDSVDVSEVEVEGEEANATVAFTGGGFDGQTLVVNLVQEEGDWKLNEAEGFKHLDREKLIGTFERTFEEQEEVEPELAECVIEGLEETSDSELEEMILGGPEGIVAIAEECAE